MKPVFCYLKSSPLDAESIAQLTSAGYVLVAVEDLESVRIIDPVPEVPAGAVLKAMAKAMVDSPLDTDVKQKFALNLAKAISKDPQQDRN